MTYPYLQPTETTPVPRGLTLSQFIQTVMVGISDLPGTLVRPTFQTEPPKQPDVSVNWMAVGISVATPDSNSYFGIDDSGATISQRHEDLEITCSLFGPDALDTYGLLRDGFQIPPNRDALFKANMGFTEITPARRIPDLVNERFVDRYTTSVFLRREIQRVYPLLTFTSARGTIHTVVGDEQYLLDWVAQS